MAELDNLIGPRKYEGMFMLVYRGGEMEAVEIVRDKPVEKLSDQLRDFPVHYSTGASLGYGYPEGAYVGGLVEVACDYFSLWVYHGCGDMEYAAVTYAEAVGLMLLGKVSRIVTKESEE